MRPCPVLGGAVDGALRLERFQTIHREADAVQFLDDASNRRVLAWVNAHQKKAGLGRATIRTAKDEPRMRYLRIPAPNGYTLAAFVGWWVYLQEGAMHCRSNDFFHLDYGAAP